MHDLVIRGGTVVDGTGRAPLTADIAIDGSRISDVGGDVGAGRREIDADGLLVAPGWVDIHTHYDGQALWDPLLEPSALHGVTTAVMGNCGVGFAPVRPHDRAWTVALMEGVEDIPASVFEHGLDWSWQTFPDYLAALDRQPRAIDVAAQVPHAALRVYAMGERGIDHTEVPTDDELEDMGRLAAEAILAGAVGFSTSRSRTHASSDGRLTPTLTAEERELVAIAKALGHARAGTFELVFEDGEVEDHLRIARRMCEVSARPMSLIVLQRPGRARDEYRTMLQALEDAQADGLAMRGQIAPRPIGLLISLDSRLNPLRGAPTYAALSSESPAGLRAALNRVDVREQILGELTTADNSLLDRFPRVFELGDPPDYTLRPERELRVRAAAQHVLFLELVYDILTRDGTLYVPAANFVDGDFGAIREMLVHPLTVPGLSDAGAHCTAIGDFDFPTFTLGYWSRDAEPDERVPIESIVRQQCWDTAKLVGLEDRGVLLPGRRADVNLIDFAALTSTTPHLRDDLPGGGSRLVGRGLGYVATLVAGDVVFEDGEHTGRMPGRVARPTGAPAA